LSRIALTDDYVRRIRLPIEGQEFHRDEVLRGFALRVTANGSLAWIVESNTWGRRTLALPINRKRPDVAAARKAAIDLIGRLNRGDDPVKVKQERKAAQAARAESPTFGALLDEYVADMERRGRVSAREIKHLFAKNVFDSERDLLAADVTPGHIIAPRRSCARASAPRSSTPRRRPTMRRAMAGATSESP
jgi:hypothetical protein